MAPKTGRRRTILCILSIAVVAVALRVPGMLRSIWYDEWCRTHQYLNSDNLRRILLHDVHNPLYNAFMYGWIRVFGDSEVSIRLPSLIAGLGSLWLLCRFLAARMGLPLALAVGALFACNPVHVWYSAEAKNTMFVVATSTLAMIALTRLADGSRPGCSSAAGRVLAAAGAMLAAFCTDFVTLLVVAPAAAWAIVAALGRGGSGPDDPAALETRGRRLRPVLWALGIAGALAAPLVVFKSGHTEDLWRGYLDNFKIRQGAMLLGHDFPLGDTFTEQGRDRMLAGLIGFVVVLPLLAAGGWRLCKRGAGRLIVAVFAFAILAMALASSAIGEMLAGKHQKIYQPRNLIVALNPYGIVLMAGTLAMPRAWLRRGAIGLVLAASLAASVAMLVVPHAHDVTLTPAHDWRAIARRIVVDAPPPTGPGGSAASQPIIFSKIPTSPLGYYLTRPPGIELAFTWVEPLDPAAIAKAVAAGRPVYLIVDQNWWPLDEAQWAAISNAAAIEPAGRWNTLSLYRLGPRR